MITGRKLQDSIKYVVDNSDHVTIDEKAIDNFISGFNPNNINHWTKACPFKYVQLKSFEDELDRCFLQDTQAFCFWGYPIKWTIKYKNQTLDGWWALLACFQKAIETGTPLLKGKYLANITLKQTSELFFGDPAIPLLQQRKEMLNEIGNTLIKKYDGRFHNFYQNASRDAIELLNQIITIFPAFDDKSEYKGRTIYFYKKAQLLIHELSNKAKASEYGKVTGIDNLTGKADYKIPAILRNCSILVYSPKLADMVDNRKELDSSSSMEVEIRANMLWANHLICKKLKPIHPTITPMVLDGILWIASQKKTPNNKPYHLTKTTAY